MAETVWREISPAGLREAPSWEGDEYHYIDDTPIRATRFRGVFSDLVKKTREVFVFEED